MGDQLYKVSAYHQGIMRKYAEQFGLALGARGLMTIQFALQDEVVCVLEVNPRASRTVPYASKATGLNLAYVGAQVMTGCKLEDLGVTASASSLHTLHSLARNPLA